MVHYYRKGETRMKTMIIQLLKFGIVGAIATALDVGIYQLLLHLSWYYQAANGVAFAVSLIFNYLASMKFVFQSKYSAHQKYKEILIFFSTSVIGLLITSCILWISIDCLLWSPLLSKGIAIACTMSWNFISRKWWLDSSPNRKDVL